MAYQRGQKMGDIGGPLIILGLLGIGGFLVYKYFFSSDASKAQAANNQTAAANTATANQTSLAAAQASGQKQSLTDSQINNMADSLARLIQAGPDQLDSGGLFTASTNVVSATSAVSSEAEGIVMNVLNPVDWAKLVSVFGTRQDYKNNTVDLVTGLREIMNQGDQTSVNSYMYAQGIGWIF